MKNVIKTIRKSILLVTVFTTILSNANEISSFTYKEDLKGNTSLSINNVKKGNQLSIKDYYGTILYKEVINRAGLYRKGFDLTSLPDGSYFFEIDKEMEITSIPFTVLLNKVTFDKEKQVTIFKPYVRKKDNLIMISKLSPNKDPLNIDLYYVDNNNESELIHSEEVKGTQNIERIFKLRKGEYKVVFKFNNKEITEFINN